MRKKKTKQKLNNMYIGHHTIIFVAGVGAVLYYNMYLLCLTCSKREATRILLRGSAPGMLAGRTRLGWGTFCAGWCGQRGVVVLLQGKTPSKTRNEATCCGRSRELQPTEYNSW